MAKNKDWMRGTAAPIGQTPFEVAVGLVRARRYAEAIPLLQRIVREKPGFTEGWLNLAEALKVTGQSESAIDAFSQALMTSPGNTAILKGLARYLVSLGRSEECLAVYEVLCAVAPQDPNAWFEFGMMLTASNRLDEAESAYRKSIGLDANRAEVYQALAILIHMRDDAEGQLWAIGNASRLAPQSVEFLCGHARSLQYWGKYEEALSVLENGSPSIRQAPEVRAVRAMLMPMVAKDVRELTDARARWMDGLAALRREGVTVKDPRINIQITPYYLAYQGLDSRPLAEEAAAFYRECAPSLTQIRPNLERNPLGGRRLRVGFLSAHLRTHSVGRVLNRFLRELDRDRIEVVNFQIPDGDVQGLKIAAALAERNIPLHLSPDEQLKQVAAEQCDVLINPEHSLLPTTYYHAFARLAPIQCATWGHPGTTGSSAIDYWLSWDRWDPETNKDRYSERLIRLASPPMIVDRVHLPDRYHTRAELGMPEDRRIYLCPQTLYKFHPHFDDLLIEILRQDDKAVLVLFDGRYVGWNELLRCRLRKLEPTIDERVIFLPKLKYDRYLSLLSHANVVLDTLYFGGGTSALDAIAVGAPVVTLPVDAMQSRMTAAFYEEIGVTGLTARSAQEYVEIAGRIAREPAERDRLSRDIIAKGEVLFDNLAPAKELSDFLVAAAAQVIG